MPAARAGAGQLCSGTFPALRRRSAAAFLADPGAARALCLGRLPMKCWRLPVNVYLRHVDRGASRRTASAGALSFLDSL